MRFNLLPHPRLPQERLVSLSQGSRLQENKRMLWRSSIKIRKKSNKLLWRCRLQECKRIRAGRKAECPLKIKTRETRIPVRSQSQLCPWIWRHFKNSCHWAMWNQNQKIVPRPRWAHLLKKRSRKRRRIKIIWECPPTFRWILMLNSTSIEHLLQNQSLRKEEKKTGKRSKEAQEDLSFWVITWNSSNLSASSMLSDSHLWNSVGRVTGIVLFPALAKQITNLSSKDRQQECLRAFAMIIWSPKELLGGWIQMSHNPSWTTRSAKWMKWNQRKVESERTRSKILMESNLIFRLLLRKKGGPL